MSTSWYLSARSVISRWGAPARFGVKHIIANAFPGGNVAGELIDRVLECVHQTAKDQEENEANTRNLASEEELQRVGEVLDEVNGKLSKLMDQITFMDGLPDAANQVIRFALATDDAVREGFANLEGIVGRFERIEEQGREILSKIGYGIDLQSTILELVTKQSVVVDFVNELRAGGVQPRQLGDSLAKFSHCLAQSRVGHAKEALPQLRSIEFDQPTSVAVQVVLAASSSLVNDLHSADRALTKAAKLRPADARLSDLSRGVTEACSTIETDQIETPTQSSPNLGDELDGWKLTQILGQGGWGQVFRAERDTHVRALKVLRPELSKELGFENTIKREILTLNKLGRQPYIVEFDDFGYARPYGNLYYLMELIEGESLQTRLRRSGPLSVADAVKLFGLLAGEGGLASAHAQGIVHRDIKPANILLRALDNSPVLVDFSLDKAITKTFAAPEQLRGKPADTRSDVYSLAASLLFATIQQDEAAQIFATTRQEPFEFDSSKIPNKLEPIRELLSKSLHPKPEHRPKDSAAFFQLLRLDSTQDKLTQTFGKPLIVNIAAILTPQVVASDLPPIPQDILALEGQLKGLRDAIDSIEHGNHPDIREAWQTIQEKNDSEGQPLIGALKQRIEKDPSTRNSELCSIAPDVPQRAVLSVINALKRLVELKRERTEIEIKLARRQEEDFKEILEQVFNQLGEKHFPLAAWVKLEPALSARRYSFVKNLQELLSKAEEHFATFLIKKEAERIRQVRESEERHKNEQDETAWNKARQLNTAEGFEAYINTFPAGRYAAEAKKHAAIHLRTLLMRDLLNKTLRKKYLAYRTEEQLNSDVQSTDGISWLWPILGTIIGGLPLALLLVVPVGRHFQFDLNFLADGMWLPLSYFILYLVFSIGFGLYQSEWSRDELNSKHTGALASCCLIITFTACAGLCAGWYLSYCSLWLSIPILLTSPILGGLIGYGLVVAIERFCYPDKTNNRTLMIDMTTGIGSILFTPLWIGIGGLLSIRRDIYIASLNAANLGERTFTHSYSPLGWIFCCLVVSIIIGLIFGISRSSNQKASYERRELAKEYGPIPRYMHQNNYENKKRLGAYS